MRGIRLLKRSCFTVTNFLDFGAIHNHFSSKIEPFCVKMFDINTICIAKVLFSLIIARILIFILYFYTRNWLMPSLDVLEYKSGMQLL